MRRCIRTRRTHSENSFGSPPPITASDYYRLPVLAARKHLDELADTGVVHRVNVQGWKGPAYLSPGAAIPRHVRARAILSPFDPLIWHRERTERIFDFHYRIEIYTPESQRQYGYYVLPFLMDEASPARVDLKADRHRGVLQVQAAHLEPGHDAGAVATALADELRNVADWQELETISVAERGSLAASLRRAVRPQTADSRDPEDGIEC